MEDKPGKKQLLMVIFVLIVVIFLFIFFLYPHDSNFIKLEVTEHTNDRLEISVTSISPQEIALNDTIIFLAYHNSTTVGGQFIANSSLNSLNSHNYSITYIDADNSNTLSKGDLFIINIEKGAGYMLDIVHNTSNEAVRFIWQP